MANRGVLGANHIAPGGGGAASYEPVRKNHFKVEIDGIGNGESVSLSLVSFPIPTTQVERITIDYGNEQRYVAGGASFEQATLTVVDYVKPEVAKTLYDWWKKVYDPETGKIGLAGSYKKTARVIVYSPDEKVVRTWSLQGVFPTNFNAGEFSMSERGSVQNITMQLSVDLVKLTK